MEENLNMFYSFLFSSHLWWLPMKETFCNIFVIYTSWYTEENETAWECALGQPHAKGFQVFNFKEKFQVQGAGPQVLKNYCTGQKTSASPGVKLRFCLVSIIQILSRWASSMLFSLFSLCLYLFSSDEWSMRGSFLLNNRDSHKVLTYVECRVRSHALSMHSVPERDKSGLTRFPANESPKRTGLHWCISAKSSFYLPAFEISRSCRTASEQCLLASFKILTPPPLPPSECVFPPHKNILEDARHWIGLLQFNPSTKLAICVVIPRRKWDSIEGGYQRSGRIRRTWG